MRKLYFLIIFILSISAAEAQNLPALIKQRSKAVVAVAAFGVNGAVVDRSNGFFISSDGMMVMPAYALTSSDSLVVTMHNGRKVQIDRVLSIHWYCNLAMVKVKGVRDVDYLTPGRLTIREPEEVLVLVNESGRDVSQVGRISNVVNIPGITRIGQVGTTVSANSMGAPIINTKGELIAIYINDETANRNFAMSSLAIIDDNWTTVDLSISKFFSSQVLSVKALPYFTKGMMAFCVNDYGDASRHFTYFIKDHGDMPLAYILRAVSRLGYGNQAGWSNDVDFLMANKDSESLGFFLSGQRQEAAKKYDSAFDSYYEACKSTNPLGDAYLGLGMMVLSQNKDVRKAFDLFSQAIFKDSLIATAYFERGKLLMQHSSNADKALADISQAIYLNPSIEGIFTIRGTIFLDQKNYAIAIRDFDEALRRKSKDSHALLNRGIAYYNLGMKDKACKDWGEASRLGNEVVYRYISRYCSDNIKSFY